MIYTENEILTNTNGEIRQLFWFIFHGPEPRTTTIEKPRFKSLLFWISHRSKEIVYIPSCAMISLLSTSQTFIFYYLDLN
jgi:hypothetical protein